MEQSQVFLIGREALLFWNRWLQPFDPKRSRECTRCLENVEKRLSFRILGWKRDHRATDRRSKYPYQCLASTRQDPDPLGSKATATTKEDILKSFNDWSPELLRFIQTAAGEITCRTLYMLRPGMNWPHQEGATLIGDSAHFDDSLRRCGGEYRL